MAIDRAKAEAVLTQARRTPAGLKYFYDQLSSPDWIEPLRQIGVFATPAPVIREEGYISFPQWPESQYLVRMADRVPRVVRDIILKVPPTDNVSVHEDFVSAALRMPLRFASEIAVVEAEWIEKVVVLHALHPEKVGELVGHLALGGQQSVALRLARALLSVRPDDRTRRDDYPFSPEPVAKFDNWHYQRVLNRDIVDKVFPVAATETFRLVADLLQSAIEIHNRKYVEATEAKEDYSTIWRPNLEQERHQDLKQTLVTGVRITATRLANAGAAQTLSVVEELRNREWHIFQRLASYVLAVSPHTPVADIERIIIQATHYERQGEDPEFDLLLRNGMGRVGDTAREQVLRIITEGPHQEVVTKRWYEATGKELTQAEFERHSDTWKLQWLALLEGELPPKERKQLEQLTAKYGQAATEPRESATWVGPTSPVSANDLRRMSIPELVNYLHSFKPSNDWASPSPEGLSRTLAALVGEDPEKFAQSAVTFRSLHPTYVRGILNGLETGLKAGKTFEWVEVVHLCRWIAEQPRDHQNMLGEDADPDWEWARKQVASLIGEGLLKNSIALICREDVWRTLQVLVEDPDPAPGRETKYLDTKHFPGMLALNTVRGVALDATIKFGLWLQTNGEQPLEDVGPVLDRHLDLTVDPSYAVREVCGHLFPWLVKLDQEWATKRVSVIFSAERPDHRWIAWENYIVFCWPYDPVLPVLTEQYLWAIGQIGEAREQKTDEAERHLAEHLVAFHWRGLLNSRSESLLERFLARAPEDLRHYALEFAGRSLDAGPNVDISEAVMGRLRELWESRLAQASTTNLRKELAAFGWWFISGKFDEDWRCRQLIDALRLSGSIDPDWEVVKHLPPYIPTRPLWVLEALRLVIEADRQGWSIYGWQDEARLILQETLAMERPEIRTAAKEVIDLLVAKGHITYRQLLKAKT